MAYVDTGILEEEEQSPQVPGSGASIQQPTSNAMASGVNNKQKTPGRFTNIAEYLRVNAPQEFGTQVAGKIGQDIQQGQNVLNQATKTFQDRADAGAVYDTQGLTEKVSQTPEQIGVEEFKAIRDAQYSGPSQLSDTPDLYQQATGAPQSAVNKANASKTEAGRFALLGDYFGKPTYNQGQKTLDNVLIQNDPKARESFAQMQQNAKQLQSQANQASTNLSQYAAQKRADTEKTASDARAAVGSAYSGLSGDLDTRLSDAQAAQASRFAMLRYALAKKDVSGLSEEDKALVGADKWGQGVQYIDPASYLSKAELSKTGLTSQSEADRLRALANLSDMSDPFGEAQEFGTQAGKDSVLFDIDKFLAEMNMQQRMREALNTPKPTQELEDLMILQRQLQEPIEGVAGGSRQLSNVVKSLKPFEKFMGGKTTEEFIDSNPGLDSQSLVGLLVEEANRQRNASLNNPLAVSPAMRAQGVRTLA